MGCSHHHHGQQSNKRSTEYYRTPEGKQKRKELNRRRSKSDVRETPMATDSGKQEQRLLKYLQFILEQVDRRLVSISEVRRFYEESCETVRQHGLERWQKSWQSRDG